MVRFKDCNEIDQLFKRWDQSVWSFHLTTKESGREEDWEKLDDQGNLAKERNVMEKDLRFAGQVNLSIDIANEKKRAEDWPKEERSSSHPDMEQQELTKLSVQHPPFPLQP